ncbi:MAG: protease modulator HflC [Vicinamibacterales bacterium]|nr:protease modulator HflC [Vicinamibacterales bacterium]
MNRSQLIGVVLGLVVLVLLAGKPLYTVTETNQAIITQFGNPIGDPVTEPGLHLKLPYIQTANMFEKRFLEWDGFPNQVPTRDRRFIFVDTYARWRITDPLLFFQRLRDERGAQSRLDDILDGETRNAVARHDLIEIVRTSNRVPVNTTVGEQEEQEELEAITTGREEITQEILQAAAAAVGDLGIELLDLKFKRINYVPEVQQDVFARMIAERQRIAEEFRSEGQGESARIQGERERDLAQIESQAFRIAEELRGEADAKATAIYAAAYGRDASFYAFTKSLETYERTMDPNTVFILGTDSEFLRFLETPR